MILFQCAVVVVMMVCVCWSLIERNVLTLLVSALAATIALRGLIAVANNIEGAPVKQEARRG